jgi:WD40 repeat protein
VTQTAEPALATALPDSPYVGLGYYTEQDADVFFGRDAERKAIIGNLRASRLTLLYAESGVGKSSLLRAGVAPRLRELAQRSESEERRYIPVIFSSWSGRPTAMLIDSVRDAVRVEAGTTIPRRRLVKTIETAAAALGGTLVVILDQFEEYFLYRSKESKPGTFADALAECVNLPGLRANFLIAVREDAYAGLGGLFKGQITNVYGNYLRLEFLDRQNARDAIVKPLEWFSEHHPDDPMGYEPALVDAVLDQVARGKILIGETGMGTVGGKETSRFIETPYLSLVMERLWRAERAAGSQSLRLETLEKLGGAEQIVRDHLKEALTTLSPVSQEAAAEVFSRLVTPSGTKIALPVSDLAEFASVREGELEPMLRTLAAERILRPVGGNGSSRYEIYHDVLANPVLAWRREFQTKRELEREREADRKQTRRMLLVVAVALVVVAAILAVAVYALVQSKDAQHQRDLVKQQSNLASWLRYTVGALSTSASDPELSMLLAVRAARIEPTSASAALLRHSLEDSHLRAVVRGRPPIRAVFDPRGRFVAVGDGDGAVSMFRADGAPVWHGVRPKNGAINSVAFSRNGKLLVSAGDDGTARIWRVTDGKQLRVLKHGGRVIAASFSPDGDRVVTTGVNRARIWSRRTGRMAAVLDGHGRRLRPASFSGNGLQVLTVTTGGSKADDVAEVWDGRNGKLLYRFGGPTRPVTSAAFSPDGTLVVTGGPDNIARIWRGGRPVANLPQRTPVTSVAFNSKGGKIVAGRTDGAAVVWEWRAHRPTTVAGAHGGSVTSASFSPNDLWVVMSSTDGTARVSKADSGELFAPLVGDSASITNASFSSNGALVLTASDDGTARVWDPGTASQLRVTRMGRRKPVVKPAPRDGVTDASFSPDGRLVVTSGGDGFARVWTREGKPVVHGLDLGARVNAASFSPDGSRFVTASGRTAAIWRVANGRRLVVLPQSAAVLAASFSPDGRRLVTVAGDRARIQSWRTRRELATLDGHHGLLTDASFSHDGSKVVTAGTDHAARIWDAKTGRLVQTLDKGGHTEALTSAEFAPDDRTVVTTSSDDDALIWSVKTGHVLYRLQGHAGTVNDASFSPDGRWIVTAGPTAAFLWLAATGAHEIDVSAGTSRLTSVSFSRDGKTILSSGADGTVRMYRCAICGTLPQLEDLAHQRLAATHRKLTPAERARYVRG